ncbi:hypothetical protein [Nocardioides aquiterrae]|uniref:GNAT family N-acetyltransferase n=1 Tax=Nocardioides aquiterrae TaxID=203799 RepID=A0ABP4FB73_9ACTN
MTDLEIGGWDRHHAGTPHLVLRTSAPAEEAIGVLVAELARERFKAKERGPDHFRSRFVDWFDVASGTFNWTTIEGRATPDGGGTAVTLTVVSGEEYRRAPKRAAIALTTAVQQLRAHGHEVSPGAWTLA